MTVTVLLLLLIVAGCYDYWEDHLKNQNHVSMFLVDLYVMVKVGDNQCCDFLVLIVWFVEFYLPIEVCKGIHEGKNYRF